MRSHGWLACCGILAFVIGCDQLPTPNPLDPNATPSPAPSIGTGGTLDENASIQVFFSKVDGDVRANQQNPENIAQYCVRAIASAKSTLDVCCHEIDNRAITEAIVAAHLSGVKVRVITETEYLDEVGPKVFRHASIPLVSDERSGLMHQKFIVIDGQAVWTGSFNFTDNCAFKNNNNGIYIRDTRVARNYTEWFNWFWDVGRKQKRRSGGPTPFPDVQLADGTRFETRLTTFDNATLEKTIAEVIGESRRSIKFLAFSFTHKGIARAMLRQTQMGAKIMGVFESRNIKGSVYGEMNGRPNVAVYADANPYNLHHKVIIVDDQVVIAGSFNFSENASSANDENYVVISGNRQVARAFLEEFHRIFSKASGNLATQGSNSTSIRR